jgi:hypothetical protein
VSRNHYNPQIVLVNSTWDIQFIKIGGKELSLNDIEHRILRKEFNEPTMHFAIVCASKSCPPLRSEGDFTKDRSLIDFFNKYSHIRIKQDAKINFLDYDWSLNN